MTNFFFGGSVLLTGTQRFKGLFAFETISDASLFSLVTSSMQEIFLQISRKSPKNRNSHYFQRKTLSTKKNT